MFARCLLHSLLVYIRSRDMMRNPVSTLYRDWHGYEEEEEFSIPHRRYVSLNSYTGSFRVHRNSRARSVMPIFAIFNIFIIDN